MFIFLLILGAALMVYGFKRRAEEAEERIFAKGKADQASTMMKQATGLSLSLEVEEDVEDLRHRMETLEKTLFEELLKWQMERENLKSDLRREDEMEASQRNAEVPVEEEQVPEKKPMPDHVKRVWDLLKEGHSTAEVSRQLSISKGEVLLLKNLSKHYKE